MKKTFSLKQPYSHPVHQKRSVSARVFSCIFILGTILFISVYSTYQIKYDTVQSVRINSVSATFVYPNIMRVTIHTLIDPNVKTTFNGTFFYGDQTVSLSEYFTSAYSTKDIIIENVVSYLNITDDARLQGELQSTHNDASFIVSKILVDQQINLRSIFTLNIPYDPVNTTHWKATPSLSIQFPLIYDGIINISYDTYCYIDQREMDALGLTHNGIKAGYIYMGSFEFSSTFKSTILYTQPSFYFDLSKIIYYKEYPEDVLSYCGRALDYRIASYMQDENTTAPKPEIIFSNLCVSINDTCALFRNQTGIVKI